MAEAALALGATVTLVHGPLACEVPGGLRAIGVETAQEMYAAVMAELPGVDVFVGVAAVADYRPATQAQHKIKKENQTGDELVLALIENPDIIASVAGQPNPPYTVAFAAETRDPLATARAKRERKGVHAIIVNDVSQSDIGFNGEHNAVTFIDADSEHSLTRQSKQAIATQLMALIAQRVTKHKGSLAVANREPVAN